jgi:hypothetical protein
MLGQSGSIAWKVLSGTGGKYRLSSTYSMRESGDANVTPKSGSRGIFSGGFLAARAAMLTPPERNCPEERGFNFFLATTLSWNT